MAAVALTAPHTVKAQTSFYWKGGAGNWDTATANWYPQASATGAEAFVSSTSSIARIGDLGAAGTITLTTAITAQELDIDNTTGYTIAGTPALTLASGNITTNFLSGNTAGSITTVISAPLAGTNINVSATGTAGSTTGFGNDTVTLSGTNTFTGNLNLGAAASGPAGTGINRVNITTAAALPSTATVNFLNTNTSFAVTGGTLTLPNNFVLNPNGGTTYTPGAFVSYIGANSGFALTANGTISGNGDVVFASGINGGAGLITLNKANTYLGATSINNSTTGVIRIGVNNALPTGTALTFGDGSLSSSTKGNTFGALDLNGLNQQVASLSTNLAPVAGAVTTAGTANGITNTVGATTSVLTISGSATTTYSSVIGIPANVSNLTGASNNIALTLASTNTGTQTLSGANTYTGATRIGGGTLVLSATGSINGSTLVQVTGTGALTLNNAAALADAGTLSLASGTTLNLNAASGTSETISGLILDGTAEPAGTYTAAQLGGLDAGITFTSGSGETLTVAAVPEPTTWLAGGLTVLLGALAARRRRTQA